MPVMKACGKKKPARVKKETNCQAMQRKEEFEPEIQKTLGVPFSIQLLRKVIRSLRSVVHEERGFRDRKPLSAHRSGT